MEKFKVGDKVKLNKNKSIGDFTYGQGSVKHGEIGIITKIMDDEYIVNFPSKEDWTGKDDDVVLAYEINTIEDLKFADIVTLQNGERYVYGDKHLYGENTTYLHDCAPIERWTENLKHVRQQDYDIVKVEREGSIIYEREEIKEMTVEEISKELGYEVKIVKEKK